MSNTHRIFACIAASAVLVAATAFAAAQDAPRQVTPDTTASPGQQQEATDEAGEQQRVEVLREASAERRDEAVAAARRAADDLDRQIERLQEQMDEGWERMSQRARARSRASMADLRQRRNALAEWLGGMRHGSGAAWDEVRGGFVKSYQELAEAMAKARTEFAKQAQDGQAPEADSPQRQE